jgi:predicted esterase
MLDLAGELPSDGIVFQALQAAGNTWYPRSFLAPIEHNEPALSSALQAVDRLVSETSQEGIPPRRIVLLGFSQGACLATEYAARNAKRYGGVIAFSGGLIGPDGTARAYGGSFDAMPTFIGCSDVDPHIPVERVHETARVYDEMDARVDKRIYSGMGHTINQDELDAAQDLIRSVATD